MLREQDRSEPDSKWASAPQGATLPGYRAPIELRRAEVGKNRVAKWAATVGAFAQLPTLALIFVILRFRTDDYIYFGFGPAAIAVVGILLAAIGIALAARSWHCECWRCSRVGLWLSISAIAVPGLILVRVLSQPIIPSR